MTLSRTYFLNRMNEGDLAALLSARKDFFLENVSDMNGTLQMAYAWLAHAGLTHRYLNAPSNPFASVPSQMIAAIPLLGSLWVLCLAAASLGRANADVTFKQTADQSLSVVFARKVRNAAP
ncbi:hypothetical protein [Achromobacter pestifer]|uniref:Uncharacterized protein n=1 Tax=Achromobacter pestifer TaxID=1353889 RepID=A0A6S6ZKW8_9BURK|nr:hypothetical protein [Achromobacter pestifer]CAB3685059.1 hypothetical protein LMG3431_04571 [Achromobacter pestifer]